MAKKRRPKKIVQIPAKPNPSSDHLEQRKRIVNHFILPISLALLVLEIFAIIFFLSSKSGLAYGMPIVDEVMDNAALFAIFSVILTLLIIMSAIRYVRSMNNKEKKETLREAIVNDEEDIFDETPKSDDFRY